MVDKIGMIRRLSIVLALCAASLALVGGFSARGDDEHDHDRAREARERGEILPLQEIIGLMRKRVDGRIAEVKIEREKDLWVYEIRVIDQRGRLIEVDLDAKTGRILEIEDE